MDKTEWLLCLLCGSNTRNKVWEGAVLINYPLYCPKCRQETLIQAKNLQVTVIKELCLTHFLPYRVQKRRNVIVKLCNHEESP